MPASTIAALRHLILLSLCASSLYAQAATALGQLPYIPTRYHLCSVELASLEGQAREEEMQLCLRARFRAEKAINSACAVQIKHMHPAPRNADERYRAKRQCQISHLSASYKDLPEFASAAPAAAQAKRLTNTANSTPQKPSDKPQKNLALSASNSSAGHSTHTPMHTTPVQTAPTAPPVNADTTSKPPAPTNTSAGSAATAAPVQTATAPLPAI